MAKDEERDWARANPVPQAAATADALVLWNFPVGGSALAAEHAQAIERFTANDLGLSPAASPTQFHVVGHASASGAERGNLALSEQRAEAVAAWFERRGVPRARVSASWLGSEQPVDTTGTGVGQARNRRVEINRFRAQPASKVVPLRADPARGKPIAAARSGPGGADGVAGTLKGTIDTPPFPIRLRALAVDVRLIGEVELSVLSGRGDTALVGAAQGGRLSPEFETLIVDGLKGKAVVSAGEDGRPPGLQLGAQLENIAGKPELGVQAGTKPVYVEFELKESTPLDELSIRGVRVAARFSGKVRFEFGPSETTAARLLATPAGAVAGVIATAALINGGTALLAQAAREEGLQAMVFLAERDGVATRVAYEVLGTDALVHVKNQELQWVKLEGDMRRAFRAGMDRVDALLAELGPDGRTERRLRWDAAYAPGLGVQDFPDVQRHVFDALGGCEWKDRTAGTPLEAL